MNVSFKKALVGMCREIVCERAVPGGSWGRTDYDVVSEAPSYWKSCRPLPSNSIGVLLAAPRRAPL